MSIFTKFCCLVIGWNSTLLKECGEASHKMLKRYMAAIVIMSVIWGTIGYSFADKYIQIEPLTWKITVACMFILIIICIERFIILAVGKSGWMKFFRIILAFLMALLGATIFDQIIFRQDVEVKMKDIRTEQINQEIPKRTISIDAEIRQLSLSVDSLQQVINELNNEIAKKPFITAVNITTTTTNLGVDSLGIPIKRETRVADRANVPNPLFSQRDAYMNTLEKQRERLQMLQDKKLNIGKEVRDEFENLPNGFLEELKALMSILWGDLIATIFYIILLLFLLTLELLIVTAKMSGQQCDYDLLIEHQLRRKAEMVDKM